MKLTIFFNPKSKAIYLKSLIVYEIKLKVISWLTQQSGIYKHRFLLGNEIVPYLSNGKCCGVDQNHLENP